MAQNIYDKQEFFQQYGQLPRSIKGLDGAPEWPTLQRLVGDVKGAHVLDLGCGYGWFCRWAKEGGAKSVQGIDVSTKMLEKARSFASEQADADAITYECGDLENGNLPAVTFDIIYSSLTLHYLPSVYALFANIFNALRSGGRLVFSIEHPVMTAPTGATADGTYKRDADGNTFWPLNRYSDEGLRETEWLGTGGIRKYHRTVETYLTALIQSGFILTTIRESWDGMNRTPKPDEEDWGGHRPFFLIVAAKKPDSGTTHETAP